VAFQSFVVLVFIWLGDGSRLNQSCLHDLGVLNHHCYRVSSQLLVEFISHTLHPLVFQQLSIGDFKSLNLIDLPFGNKKIEKFVNRENNT
jgi:hypothetical protein